MQAKNAAEIPPELLSPPVARAAYSDRTAWLMATMSRLAYFKFENEDELLDNFAPRLAALSDPKAVKRAVNDFIKDYERTRGDEYSSLKASLKLLDFELVDTFSNGGTQAFLAKRERDRMAVLAFRGTEKDFRDIKADLNARFYEQNGVKVHNGFYQAFRLVQARITGRLLELDGYKLYITGHSLGGALALIATRAVGGDDVAACYTFGSPRVGISEFGDSIKIPIYRVVNAADLVPRVPPALTIDLIIFFGRALKVIPYIGGFLIKSLERFRGYAHHGDMRYLSACEPDFRNLRLIANPPGSKRVVWATKRIMTEWKAGFTDHSIQHYCDKLQAYALSRVWTQDSMNRPSRRNKQSLNRKATAAKNH